MQMYSSNSQKHKSWISIQLKPFNDPYYHRAHRLRSGYNIRRLGSALGFGNGRHRPGLHRNGSGLLGFWLRFIGFRRRWSRGAHDGRQCHGPCPASTDGRTGAGRGTDQADSRFASTLTLQMKASWSRRCLGRDLDGDLCGDGMRSAGRRGLAE